MSHFSQGPPGSHDDSLTPGPTKRADGLQEDSSFRILFVNNPQPMWVYDLETLRFLEVNNAAIDHYGYSREEFLAMSIADIRPREDVPRLLQNVSGDHAGLQHSGQWRHATKNGRLIDVEISSHTLTFRGRRAELIVVHDVTKQKQAEDALKQAEQKYRSIFEEAIIGIFQSTPDGRLLSANPAMARLYGYASPEEMLDKISDVRPQLYVDPTRRDEFKRIVEEEGVVRHFEVQVYRKDGSKMWLSANARAVRENGVIVRYEGTFEDINERKLLEDQLRQALKMEAVGRLAGGVAHDFNNSLAVITGYGDLLQLHLAPDDPLRKHAEEIGKAGRRAAALTRQLLGFSRKQVISPVVLDLNAVIEELEKMLHRLIGEDIRVSFKRESKLGRVKVDPGQIEQILMNLAVNSRDAMPQGGRFCIETANVELDETYARQNAYVTPGSYIMLSVSDTGSGMDKETQTHIFEPFFTTKDPGKGTGLGLSTVYGIVKQNNGYIQVYSEPGQGATFKIYFPRVREAMKVTRPEATTLPGGAETILLVEDEEPLRKLALICLKGRGYTVLEAAEASTALQLARAHTGEIHLLLTDVVLPTVSGRELASQLAVQRPGVKILYMSGYTGDLIAQHGVLEPGTLLLEKPFTLHSLLTKVRAALGTGNTNAATAG
jgi:two-component system cell cycle sensor histidine kinase/response regulator CckA